MCLCKKLEYRALFPSITFKSIPTLLSLLRSSLSGVFHPFLFPFRHVIVQTCRVDVETRGYAEHFLWLYRQAPPSLVSRKEKCRSKTVYRIGELS